MEEQLKKVVKEALEIEDKEVDMEDVFRDYDEWDSLNELSLIALLDDEFNVQIESEEFEKLKTINDLLRVVSAKVS